MEDVASFQDIRCRNGVSKCMNAGKDVNGSMSPNVQREVTTNRLLKSMQEMREDVLEQVNDRINDMMSEVRQRIVTEKEVPAKENKYDDKRQSNEEGTLPAKVFLPRNSMLTDLMQISHIQTVYNICMMTFILLFLNTVAHDLMDTGMLFVGTCTVQKAFGKFPVCFYIWLLMKISTLVLYVPFNIWAYQRIEFSPKSLLQKVWDYAWLITFISYQILFVVFPTKALLDEDLPVACSVIILMEQTRLMMKSYAFVRNVGAKFVLYKSHAETLKPSSPSFSHYLYFLFAPTLIYRDSYPRTKEIRWKVVIRSFIELGLVIFYQAFIMERFVAPTFRIFGTQSLDWRWYMKSILSAMMPGILISVSSFYGLLHAWMNAWAEMLRFADRLFYKDWWNCTSYRAYYRTWNVTVHDWLYTYVYKDMYEILSPRNKVLATYAVFFISSIFHEYILAFTFRFFYPVLLIMFGGFGFVLMFNRYFTGNVFMWTSLCIGKGIAVSMYAMEYYARINCQPYDDKYLDLVLPRSWFCRPLSGT
ncbi:sterol O-acyltransferase 1 [Harpegnathos saltator]|uniref:sterol O-acyltransferase 1 n=1 Tax=Harpegnathos saltator TaxID=610380 RepID=UPI00058DD358|nr:sterol O-acyltransferase 1 [Harpegnathos saltator]